MASLRQPTTVPAADRPRPDHDDPHACEGERRTDEWRASASWEG